MRGLPGLRQPPTSRRACFEPPSRCTPGAGEGPLHDPRVYLLDYVPVELRLEVSRKFVIGFANCMATMAYLLRQGQLPRPNLIRMTLGVLPGLDKA